MARPREPGPARGAAELRCRQRDRVVRRCPGDRDPAVSARSRTRPCPRGLERCGFRIDEHGASASNLLFVRSLESWQRAARSWIEDPTQEKALILTSVLVDSRPVWGVHTGTPVADTFRLAPESPELLRMLARFALSHRPPTGFFRGLVVTHGGEHRGQLDLKHGGAIPIVDLARWAGMAAGVTSASTVERLRAGADAGTTIGRPRAHARGRVRTRQRAAPRPSGRAAARRRDTG